MGLSVVPLWVGIGLEPDWCKERQIDSCWVFYEIVSYNILGPGSGGHPAVLQWAGAGLRPVWRREHQTGFWPVLASFGISTVYCRVLGSIRFMSFPWITLWQVYLYHLYLLTSNWQSPCSATTSGYRSGSGLMQRASDWLLSGTGVVWHINGLLLGTGVNPFHEFTWITRCQCIYTIYISGPVSGGLPAMPLRYERVSVWKWSDAESIGLVPFRYWHHVVYWQVTAMYQGRSL